MAEELRKTSGPRNFLGCWIRSLAMYLPECGLDRRDGRRNWQCTVSIVSSCPMLRALSLRVLCAQPWTSPIRQFIPTVSEDERKRLGIVKNLESLSVDGLYSLAITLVAIWPTTRYLDLGRETTVGSCTEKKWFPPLKRLAGPSKVVSDVLRHMDSTSSLEELVGLPNELSDIQPPENIHTIVILQSDRLNHAWVSRLLNLRTVWSAISFQPWYHVALNPNLEVLALPLDTLLTDGFPNHGAGAESKWILADTPLRRYLATRSRRFTLWAFATDMNYDEWSTATEQKWARRRFVGADGQPTRIEYVENVSPTKRIAIRADARVSHFGGAHSEHAM